MRFPTKCLMLLALIAFANPEHAEGRQQRTETQHGDWIRIVLTDSFTDERRGLSAATRSIAGNRGNLQLMCAGNLPVVNISMGTVGPHDREEVEVWARWDNREPERIESGGFFYRAEGQVTQFGFAGAEAVRAFIARTLASGRLVIRIVPVGEATGHLRPQEVTFSLRGATAAWRNSGC